MKTDIREPGSEEVISTFHEISDFMNSPVWADMRSFLDEKIEGMRDLLESPAYDIEDIRFTQGLISALRDMRELPELLISFKEEEEG